MPERRVRLVFAGPTALARAFQLLQAGGYACALTGAPPGGSPCGLALAVGANEVDAALAVLGALGVAPTRVGEPEPLPVP